MARYLVIEFKDNDAAEKLKEQIDSASRAGAMYRVVGVFVRPGRTCQCPDWRHINYGDKNREHGVERGEKFGWWVCTRCNKPRRAGHQLTNQLTTGETYPDRITTDMYEMMVTGLQISGVLTDNVNRPKKLRKVKK